ncbi:MAG TPA: SPOR domain-containing protein [Nitrospira sp.]|uniref:SPOR domain-containing protein n=1 Tax=Cognatazoarcus halotolerans TaxID=2686016 RepID=UPI00135A9C7F|nr:SPOR domain-containing protein [Cognatazoarcus halotolerans]MBX3679420.1 SPOR domain-containing protein [Rhodocyclaceae bacterium]MCB1898015.1 SPOR domain-containing protein [Rhodocyclaceae bacterium]MCP5309580.1 SPOR domain-containing protein [Zoogloeaceae bacterium]HQV11754.1 SPOR domain-containing protein [Nitrospira sp.]
MADDDKQIELRKRARRRLVGAVALALLAAIVLPMVMDAEPRPVNRDIQVRIPAQEGENAVARPIAEPVRSGTSSSEAGGEPERPDVTPPPVVIASPREEPAKPEPVKRDPAKVEVPAREPSRAPESKVDDAARAAAILAGKPVPVTTPPVSAAVAGGFVVQLGAYRDQANANSLRGKLKAEGYPGYTEKAGDKTRVRVGPYPNREAAEAAMAKLKRLGLNGAVLPL